MPFARQHIDGPADRMCIRVAQGKGGKDRDVPLAADVLRVLHECWRLPRCLKPQPTPPAKFYLSPASVPRNRTATTIVISTAAIDAGKLIAQAKILGVTALQIGTVDGDALTIKTARGTFGAPVAELHDGWWNSIARAMA